MFRQIVGQYEAGKEFGGVGFMGTDPSRRTGRMRILDHMDSAGRRAESRGVEHQQGTAPGEAGSEGETLRAAVKVLHTRLVQGSGLQTRQHHQAHTIVRKKGIAQPQYQHRGRAVVS